jgi:hypothetical protein
MYYAGGVHGDCIEIRRAMKFIMINSTRLNNIVPKIASNQQKRELGYFLTYICYDNTFIVYTDNKYF